MELLILYLLQVMVVFGYLNGGEISTVYARWVGMFEVLCVSVGGGVPLVVVQLRKRGTL